MGKIIVRSNLCDIWQLVTPGILPSSDYVPTTSTRERDIFNSNCLTGPKINAEIWDNESRTARTKWKLLIASLISTFHVPNKSTWLSFIVEIRHDNEYITGGTVSVEVKFSFGEGFADTPLLWLKFRDPDRRNKVWWLQLHEPYSPWIGAKLNICDNYELNYCGHPQTSI